MLHLALSTLLLSACDEGTTRTNPARPAAAEPARVMLVDSVAFANELTSGHLLRVQVTHAAGVDTVPGVLVMETPVVIEDTAVVGIRYDEDRAVGLFSYDVRSRQLQLIAPPPEWFIYAVPSLAPDGRHVAFLAQSADGRGYGAVATVPALREVYRGPLVKMFETDMGVDRISWSDARHFEIRIELTHTIGGEQRIRGTLSSTLPTTAEVAVDTIRPSPQH